MNSPQPPSSHLDPEDALDRNTAGRLRLGPLCDKLVTQGWKLRVSLRKGAELEPGAGAASGEKAIFNVGLCTLALPRALLPMFFDTYYSQPCY